MATRRAPTWSTIFTASATLAACLAAAGLVAPADAQEPAECLSPDPADWPAPSKPYFMLALDTSGSMTTGVAAANSCGYAPNDRNAHSRCAMRNTVQAFSGQVNFGLATFAVIQDDCNATCYSGCDYFCFQQEINTTGSCTGCGPRPGNAATRAGAFIRVPMQQHNFWSSPPSANNVPSLLSWADNNCSGDQELFAVGNTPLNGMLRDMRRYFETGWTAPDGSVSYPSPLSAQDLDGAGVNGSTGCRSVNVILQTDGDETCDTQADAVAAATALYQTGVTVGGKTFKIRTHVINFAGGSVANTNAIAAAGGTGSSYFATNEVQLSQALASIIASATQPEVCDNTDNNCNGCTDEGYNHYCNTAQTCCTWGNDLERDQCLLDYEATITPQNPQGDVTLLPCTTPGQGADPATWLCVNPGETCDNVDNNCASGVDEGIVKCGSPLSCPVGEVCNGQDDDCDGLIDEGVCGGCVPSPEICDGCDNDCDGFTDNGVGSVPCGLLNPPSCQGTLSCLPPQAVPPGSCAPGGGFGTCSNNPQAEVCDGIDNDCDGTIDDGVAAVPCEPANTPPGLVYGGASQCVLGVQPCGGTCQGFIGPSTEVCDGIDNDCDGQVDENAFGVGEPCGINNPPCSPGAVACVNGALVCQGGVGPNAEVCDGLDNDCDGQIDETPLADAPAPGLGGCWTEPGNCCSHQNLSWCPPPGGTCNAVGALTTPCKTGTLACSGAAGWVCQSPVGPLPEVCDGLDNDCNGAPDDGSIPQVGQPCGSDVGECEEGALACVGGGLDCVGDVPPSPEACDGLDNDCEGTIDNGIPTGGPCTPPYDMVLYPGNRDNPPCQPGVLQCDGMGGVVCVGGVGPSPEVCDGLDNDCDTSVDEAGAPPDGLDGTMNPFPPPDAALGDACGIDEGICSAGNYVCDNGVFSCMGGQGPQPEQCDCEDDDCDGVTDNENENNSPPLCSPGKSCVQTTSGCQCAAPCSSGEFPCPVGQICVDVESSETGAPMGGHCIDDVCDDCASQTVEDASGNVVCAPAGTVLEDCYEPPVCVCKGRSGCQSPCLGVTCDPGLVCALHGAEPGTCVVDNCYNVPCQGCNKACDDGTCVDNPCTPESCPADQVCKPNESFTSFECVGSCADVTCPDGEVCKSGECVATCDPPCSATQVCDHTADPPACVENQCLDATCPDGACCDPLTGECGTCPCEGVICPEGQTCEATTGECTSGSIGTGGSGAGGAGQGNSGGVTSTSEDAQGVWGLATGGGGCSCRVGDDGEDDRRGLAFGALALLLLARRRRSSAERGAR